LFEGGDDRDGLFRMTITPEIRDKIIDLAERRLNARQIQRILKVPGVSTSSIHLFMATNGLRQPVRRNTNYIRKGVPFKSFSEEEDAFIEALRIQGFVCREIGEWCGRRFGHKRSASTICVRLKMIAAREIDQ